MSSKRDSSLERRLHQIERELKLVDRESRSLSKSVKKGDARVSQDASRSSREKRFSLSAGSEQSAESQRARGAGADSKQGELFSGTRRAKANAEAQAEEESASAKLSANERSKLERNQRFANYFVSGSVDGIQPLRHEKKIQRNKAIAMILFVVLALIGILYMLY